MLEARPLQVLVDTLCRIDPKRTVGSRERFNLSTRQLDSLIPQLVQGPERVVQESNTIFLIGDHPADDELNGSLRHVYVTFCAVPRQPWSGGRLDGELPIQ
jgi:hypothetical protein